MSNATETYEGISGGVQFLATRIGAALGGPFGTAYATFLTGQNSWVASTTDLVSKVNAGTDTWEDYADVASRTMSTAVAFGVLVGALPEATTLLGLTALANGALTLWKNNDYLGNIAGQLNIPTTGGNDALITELQTSFNTAKTIDPIILDLNGDGVQTSKLSKSLSAGVHFNLDAKGLAENTGWVDAQDGLLVHDIDGDGRITSGRELFGNHTLLTKGLNAGKEAGNGFEALKELDDNNDGVVDANDAAFNTLKVWRDADGDAVTDADELLTLAQAGLKSLKVTYTSGRSIDAQGNAHQQLGSFTMTSGVTRNMDDVWFAVDTARTVETNLVSVSAAIQALPNWANMGNVLSLHQAMARDATGQIQTLVFPQTCRHFS